MEYTSEDVLFESKLKEEFDKLDKDYDGLQLVLDKIADSYICDCGRSWNTGKSCMFPDRYRNGGCK